VREFECSDAFDEPFAIAIEDGLPDARDVLIEFDKDNFVSKLFEGRCQTDYPAAGEGFYEPGRTLGKGV